jgi:hypothetical protein
MRLDAAHECGGLVEGNKVFVQMTGHEVTEARIAMPVTIAFEEVAKGAQEREFKGFHH